MKQSTKDAKRAEFRRVATLGASAARVVAGECRVNLVKTGIEGAAGEIREYVERITTRPVPVPFQAPYREASAADVAWLESRLRKARAGEEEAARRAEIPSLASKLA
jgi:hypothetical protein